MFDWVSLNDWSMIAVIILAMASAGLAMWSLLHVRHPRESEVDRRLAGLAGGGQKISGVSGKASNFVKNESVNPILSGLTALSRPFETKTDYDRNELAMRMARAGYRHPHAVTVFLSLKTLLMVMFLALSLAYAFSSGLQGVKFFAVVGLSTMAGFLAPNIWLHLTSAARSDRIACALPDSLDMLVISVEAGLGLDSAIQRVGEEMERTYPDLSEEWKIATRETQMGLPRAEALQKMADRTNVSDMRSLVAILVQAERFGTGIAQTLRVHAETMRVKRRQRAEERAAKTTVKLLFPLIFFLFPVIFVVILGPPVVTWIERGGL